MLDPIFDKDSTVEKRVRMDKLSHNIGQVKLKFKTELVEKYMASVKKPDPQPDKSET